MTHSDKEEMGQEIAREIGRTIGQKIGIGFALFFGFLFFVIFGGVVVQWLWNWLVPDIFGLRTISVWEALGLLALSRILFGSFGGGRGRHRKDKPDWWKKKRSANSIERPADAVS
jgi:hypothetical protein